MPARVLQTRQEAGPSRSVRETPDASSRRTTVPKARPGQAVASSRTVASSSSASSATDKPKVAATSTSRTTDPRSSKSAPQDALLEDLSKPSRCRGEQVQSLLLLLNSSTDALNVRIFHKDSICGTQQTDEQNDKEAAKRVLIAKQVVNSIINALNDLVTSSWKPEKTKEADGASPQPTLSSSRPSSVESMKKHASTSARPVQSSQKSKMSTTDTKSTSKLNISSDNVTALLDCFRIAIEYLLQKLPIEKSKEIEGIRLSVIRKVVALELFEIASYDLELVRIAKKLSASQQRTGHTDCFLLDDSAVREISDPGSAITLLEIQCLSFVTSLSLASRTKASKMLHDAVDHSNGPLRLQWRIRKDLKDKVDAKAVDRHAYTIERAISKLISAQGEEEPEFTFACRSASLKFLQSVSDLDLSAFWDRAARVGISHFRATADDEGKFKVFEQINNLFKQLTKDGEKYGSMYNHPPQDISSSKEYKTFRDTWQHLARKAGSVCHRLTSEPLRAEKAYLEAIQNIDDSIWQSISEKAGKMPICYLFQLEVMNDKDGVRTPLQDTGRLIKVVLELQIYELLRFQKGERTIFDTLAAMQSAAVEALPSVMEMCMEILDHTIHREEGPRALDVVLNRLLEYYDEKTMPLRRARVLLRQIERHLFYPRDGDAFNQAKVMMEEVASLLGKSEIGKDVGLLRYKSQYSSTLSLLWVMLDMRQSHDSESIISHLQKGVHSLTEALPPDTKKEVAKGDDASNKILRKTSAPRQVNVREPKTPPSRSQEQKNYKAVTTIVQKTESEISSTQKQNQFDNVDRLLRLLEWSQGCDAWHGSTVVSVQVNKVGRRITKLLGTAGNDRHLVFSANLIAQYTSLGQYKLASLIVREVKNVEHAGGEAWARFTLAEADLQSHVGQMKESIVTFDKAVEILEHLDPIEKSSGLQSALQRISHTEMQASAFRTFGQIHSAKGNLTAGLQAAIESVKLSMKSGTMLARLSAKKDEDEANASPFVAQQQHQPQATSPVQKASNRKSSPNLRFSSPLLAMLHVRMVKALHESYILVSKIHCIRGSARDAEAFATECVEFDAHAQTPALHSFALLHRASIRLRMGQAQAATDDVEAAIVLIDSQHDTIIHATLAFLQGDQHFKLQSFAEAMNQFGKGQKILSKIDTAFAAENKNPDEVMEAALPTLKALLIRRQAWLLHITGEEEACEQMLDSAKLSGYQQDAGETDVLRGKIAIQQALASLKRDPQLDLLPDATISLPSVLKGFATRPRQKESYSSPRKKEAGKAAFEHLRNASRLFDRVVDQGNTVSSTALQEALVQKTICTTLLATLTSSMNMQAQGAQLQAITLERELDEVMESKLAGSKRFGSSHGGSVKIWPRFVNASAAPKSNLKKGAMIKSKAISTDEDSSESESIDAPLRAHWQALKDRRKVSLQEGQGLPSHWTVVSISFARERNCMLLTRRDGGQEGQSSLYSIPVDRQSRREGEEEEDTSTVDAILEQLRQIIAESNEATHSAQNLQSLDARKAWWTKRRLLDAKLKALLCVVEKTWLGAFKSVLLESLSSSEENKAFLQSSLQAVFAKSCVSQSVKGRKASKQDISTEIDDQILERFCALKASDCTDEELEDLAHYVIDAYQCRGIPIAVDEVDMDICVTDIRAALESYRARVVQEDHEDAKDDDHHLFLILDKDMCAIPWESMPCLRGKAICRVPSMDFLFDRLQMAPDGQFTIDSQKTRLSYVLNPSQELIRTQERFLPLLQKNVTPSSSSISSVQQTPSNRTQRPSLLDGMNYSLPTKPKWRGIVGRTPILDEFAHALESNDIMLYFGHGGAEQYIRTSRLRSLMRCAVTMLWGCSSGVLREMGDFERSGTPNNYMLAGCPSLVGNLWDATDKELDGISENVMKLFGLITDQVNEAPPKGVSLAKAVAQSRDVCKLPYLTGAACVVYGMPVYYR
ncbi:uncharacterized protein FA14DRAFT_65992 [Meira miltonrushii]|uniref:separase n=1 Tax=Meira miltonrushii TaxID=1280837 RepID=A0A316V8B8_9BASI|nr:uncharacterized protein FA14DRAFT_65992 [Meira miltonrushii]PWN33877.1 hypothetical protein FA14DRAFT_65992 [Meira miltonrushii]